MVLLYYIQGPSDVLQVSQFLPVVVNSSSLPRQPYYYQINTMAPTTHPEKLSRGNQPRPMENPAPMHVVYSPDSAPRPTLQHVQVPAVGNDASKSAFHQPVGTHFYHTPEMASVSKGGHQPSSVATTKPYAIVNAIPAQPPDVGYRPLALPQKPATVGPEEGGGGARQHMLQMAAGLVAQWSSSQQQQSGHGTPPGITLLPSPPPSYSTYVAEKASAEKLSEDVQSIQKKIGDAFTQSSEVMLVSAFEDAWSRFQDNGAVYKDSKRPTVILHGNEGFSNAVVVPGTSNQVNQMSTTPRLIPPKPLPENVRMLPASSQGHQYIISTSAPPPPQKQLLLQQVPSSYAAGVYTIPSPSSNQVHVAGMYYPGVDQSDPSHKMVATRNPLPPTRSQPAHLQRPQLQERPREGSQAPTKKGAATSKPVPVQSYKDKPFNKKCVWCGKNAIYLCSGCHREWYCGSECQVCGEFYHAHVVLWW